VIVKSSQNNHPHCRSGTGSYAPLSIFVYNMSQKNVDNSVNRLENAAISSHFPPFPEKNTLYRRTERKENVPLDIFSEGASLRVGFLSFFAFSCLSLLVIEIEDPEAITPRVKRFREEAIREQTTLQGYFILYLIWSSADPLLLECLSR